MENNRRQFLSGTLAVTVGAALSSACATTSIGGSSSGAGKIKASSLNQNEVIVFQGDSITDANRDKEMLLPNERRGFGNGYVYLNCAALLSQFAQKDLKIYNRGISGNKVFQLAERWDKDCLSLQPTVLSILVGVNDFWHMHDKRYAGTLEICENDYRALLRRTKESLPNVRLVIGEPFAVLGAKSVNESWFPQFDAYRAASKKLADEFGAIFIPYHEVFANAIKVAPPSYWTPDGVHPSFAGAALMSQAWMKYVIDPS
jgi:lysophospholipase L1-like esterase